MHLSYKNTNKGVKTIMIHSKYKPIVWLPLGLLIAGITMIVFLLVTFDQSSWLFTLGNQTKLSTVGYIMSFIWLPIIIILFFGEIRSKIVTVVLTEEAIHIRRFFGLSKRKEYQFSALEGFQTAVLSTRIQSVDCMYLLMNGKKAVLISSFYFQNYVEIKMFLENHVTHLGFHRVGVIEKYMDLTI
jgi:hypothetical protein